MVCLCGSASEGLAEGCVDEGVPWECVRGLGMRL